MKEYCTAKNYKHVTLDDRTLIQTQLQQGLKPAAIAAGMGRPRSCVTRELARNGRRLLSGDQLNVQPLQAAILTVEPTCEREGYRSCRALSASLWPVIRYGTKSAMA